MYVFSFSVLLLSLLIMPMLPPANALRRADTSETGESTDASAKRTKVIDMAQKVTRQIISSANAPGAIGPYSQAVRAGNTIYLSGSLGLDPKTGDLKEGIVEQTHQSLKNIGEVLKAAGADYGNVVKTTVLLQNISDFTTVNEVYGQYFKAPYPARAAYQVAALPKGGLVEVEAVAIAGEIEDV
uniref:2-iminobutanoate/2-iminopropanoate deaminase n=1 Tax=Caenorhabditis tropicalis TaxID=1561998 RepID=A0A1I7TEW6_9PELO